MNNTDLTAPFGGSNPEPVPALKRGDAPPPPDGYEVITQGNSETGDLYLDNSTNVWLPLPSFAEGEAAWGFWGLARKQGVAQMRVGRIIWRDRMAGYSPEVEDSEATNGQTET